MSIRSLASLVCMVLGLLMAGVVPAQQFDPIASDPVATDAKFPLRLRPFTVAVGGVTMNGRALLAQGQGPHPTVLLLHGVPGQEQNMDLAQAMRRAGWNVFTFHYRGSWGSGGDYSFDNVLEDSRSALAYLRTLDAEWRIDRKRIVLVGYSAGGSFALTTAARDPDIKSVASISGYDIGIAGQAAASNPQMRDFWLRFFRNTPPLRVPDVDALVAAWTAKAGELTFAKLAPALSAKSVLLVKAGKDTVAVHDQHYIPLATALKGSPGLSEVALDTDHDYSDKRFALARALVAWLDKQK